MFSTRWRRSGVVLLFALCACKPGPDEALGPFDSYVLLVPRDGAGAGGDLPLLARADATREPLAPLVKELMAGFGAELLRTAYMARQFVREAQGEQGQPLFVAEARAAAADAMTLVVGVDRHGAPGRGMRLDGAWLGGPVARPGAVFIGLPDKLAEDRALTQTVAARLAAYLAHLAASAGRLDGAKADVSLVAGYQMAMEVIAREWRVAEGPRGTLAPEAGTASQRQLFADVRANGFVNDEAGNLRAPQELLADAGVAATVFYRMAQNRKLSQALAPPAFYQPFASDQIPAGMSPAVVLGSFRNLQAKLLGVWMQAAARGEAPADIADLVELYGEAFPAEKAEVLRVFLVTTFGATAREGGVSSKPADARIALAELTALAAEVAAGRRDLRAAVNPAKGREPAPAPAP